jgi:translation initiation factor IF-1
MASETPIVTEATVSEVVDLRVYHVALPNGKIIVAHIPAKLTPAEPIFAVGDTVTLEMTPYDFDHARIRVIVED